MTVPLRWRKASSGTQTCVEVAHTRTAVRDSKNPTGPVLAVDTLSLIAVLKAGQLDR